MSETGFRLFNVVFSIGAELLYAAFLVLFLRPFLMARGRRQRLALVFSACLAARLLCGWTDAPQGMFGFLLTALLAAASGWLRLERAFAVLLAILYWNARVSGGLMVESLYFIAERLLPFQPEPLEAVYLRAAILILSFLLSHTLLMAAMLYAFQRRLRRRRIPLHRRELCYISFVPAAGILFGQMISKLLVEFKDGVLLRLYERHPTFLAAVPLLALLLFAGAYLTIALQQGMAALREEQAACFLERQQAQAIRNRIHEAEAFYARVHQLKHEMRGHLTAIKGLAHSGAYAALEDYIAQIDGTIGSLALTIQTGNPVTDVIVNDTRQQCLELGVRFQVNFHYPRPEAFDALDVGIILQNLLQNALEACEKIPEDQRFITLAGARRGRFFLIEVKNAFAGEVVLGQDGLPVTAKREDAPMHGIGLGNVRRAAEKYMGELELKTEPGVFSATVLLQERGGL